MELNPVRRLLASLCLAVLLSSCGGGGDGSGVSTSPTLVTSAARDGNGDVLVDDAAFVSEPEIEDWLLKVKAYPGNFNFHLYIPQAYKSTQQSYPLLIHLHGDNGYQDTLSQLTLTPLLGSALQPLVSAGNQLNPAGRAALNAHVMDSFVIAPEVPHVDRTGNYVEPLGYWNPNAIKKLIAYMQSKYRIDASRIYVTGMSFGGGGTWHVTNRSSGIVAAAVPICGGYDIALEAGTYGIPFWVFHSYDDATVPFRASLSVFNALTRPALAWPTFPAGDKAPTSNYTISYSTAAGLSPWVEGDRSISGTDHYTLYATGGHNAWDRAYADPVMWDWLYAQKKSN